MLPPETPLITSVASSSVVGRPFQSNRVACISVSTPKPKAAALAPQDVRWVLTEGAVEGLDLSVDLTWLAWESLATQGAATEAELDAVLAGDDTAFLVMRDTESAASFCEEIKEML